MRPEDFIGDRCRPFTGAEYMESLRGGRGMSYNAVPVFWTIQYLKRLDYVGHASAWDEIVLNGDPGNLEFIAYYVKDGHVAAAAGMDRDRDMAALIELFTLRQQWRAAELGASPAEVLETLPSLRKSDAWGCP